MKLSVTQAGLLVAALLLSVSPVSAQAPIVNAGSIGVPVEQEVVEPTRKMLGRLYSELQMLRQEVMELRGLVEEQGYQVTQVQQQSLERYIDLDRRITSGAIGPASPEGNSAGGNAATSKPVLTPGNDVEDYRVAYSLVKRKQWSDAIGAFNDYLQRYPSGKYAPNALYWLGEMHLVNDPQDLGASRTSFGKLLSQYPDDGKVPDALYKLGKVYFLQGEKDKAKHLLEQVIERYGSGSGSAHKLAKKFLRENY